MQYSSDSYNHMPIAFFDLGGIDGFLWGLPWDPHEIGQYG